MCVSSLLGCAGLDLGKQDEAVWSWKGYIVVKYLLASFFCCLDFSCKRKRVKTKVFRSADVACESAALEIEDPVLHYGYRGGLKLNSVGTCEIKANTQLWSVMFNTLWQEWVENFEGFKNVSGWEPLVVCDICDMGWGILWLGVSCKAVKRRLHYTI